ncbi:MAG: sugar-transfer associated ATP-grasp domain-containing protein [Hyphomonadaceae bacterium]
MKPSEIQFRTNRADAVRRFVDHDLRRWVQAPDKKPILRQAAEVIDLWRRYRYWPYQYVKNDLYRRSVGGDYVNYIPTILAERYVYEINDAEAIDTLEDKFAYDERMASLGLRYVPVMARIFRAAEGLRIEDRAGAQLTLAKLAAISKQVSPEGLFVKPRFGLAGLGAFRLKLGAEGFEQDGEPLSEPALLQKLATTDYVEFVVQPYFQQHEVLRGLNPSSVNTIRVLTLRTDEQVDVISALFRVGSGVKETDNWAYGGYALPLCMKSGRVGREAYVHESYAAGRSLTHHAITGVEFGSVVIPYMDEVVELVTRGARGLAPARVIGWDIAIGPDGPVAIEANAIPGIRIMQSVGGGLRSTAYGEEMAQRFAWR